MVNKQNVVYAFAAIHGRLSDLESEAKAGFTKNQADSISLDIERLQSATRDLRARFSTYYSTEEVSEEPGILPPGFTRIKNPDQPGESLVIYGRDFDPSKHERFVAEEADIIADGTAGIDTN